MIRYEEYLYFRDELLKRKTYPLVMNNTFLARDFLKQLQKSYPDVKMFELGFTQYICYDERAVKRLLKMIRIRRKRVAEELEALDVFLEQEEMKNGC